MQLADVRVRYVRGRIRAVWVGLMCCKRGRQHCRDALSPFIKTITCDNRVADQYINLAMAEEPGSAHELQGLMDR